MSLLVLSYLSNNDNIENIHNTHTHTHTQMLPMGVSSCSLGGACFPEAVASAGALSWLGRATPPNVSEIWARVSEPAISTLSSAQSLWSAPSCCGCHQRTRTPSWRAAEGSRTLTNLERRHEETQGQAYFVGTTSPQYSFTLTVQTEEISRDI